MMKDRILKNILNNKNKKRNRKPMNAKKNLI